MKTGYCQIYKRALDGNTEVDYTDGTKPFACSVDDSGDYPVYRWNVGHLSIDIPLNIPHDKTESIVNQGVDGNIRYEYLYGKFRSYPEHYFKLLKSCGLLVLLGVLVTMLAMRKQRK